MCIHTQHLSTFFSYLQVSVGLEDSFNYNSHMDVAIFNWKLAVFVGWGNAYLCLAVLIEGQKEKWKCFPHSITVAAVPGSLWLCVKAVAEARGIKWRPDLMNRDQQWLLLCGYKSEHLSWVSKELVCCLAQWPCRFFGCCVYCSCFGWAWGGVWATFWSAECL